MRRGRIVNVFHLVLYSRIELLPFLLEGIKLD